MSPFRASAPLTSTWEHFDFAVDEGVATVRLNRPDKLNALTFEAYADLRDLLAELPQRGDARVLVIGGEGRGFSSGGDVEEIIGPLQEMGTAELLEFTRMTGSVVKALRECPLPVIASFNGVAAGAGAVIALACDFRIMAESASFAFLFTRVGLSGADMGAAYLLPRIVGLGHATELLMLGDQVTAQRAAAIGLAGEVVPDAELSLHVQALARRLADGPAFAFATTKSLLTRELDMGLGRGDRDGGGDPGAAHALRRLRGVLRRLERGAPSGLDRTVSELINSAAPGGARSASPTPSAPATPSTWRPDRPGARTARSSASRWWSSSTWPPGNLVTALRAAGGGPEDLVSLQVFVTAVAEYKESLTALGQVWRRHFGRRYPAMGLFGVTELYDPAAKVELMGVAVVARGG